MSTAIETPATMAAKLGVSQVELRRWLRGLAGEGHELVKHHQHNERWTFSAEDARTLIKLFKSSHP